MTFFKKVLSLTNKFVLHAYVCFMNIQQALSKSFDDITQTPNELTSYVRRKLWKDAKTFHVPSMTGNPGSKFLQFECQVDLIVNDRLFVEEKE